VTTPRDELHVLTGSYAVHALEHREREAFERHLQSCNSCETEVRAFRETAARLAMARSLQPPARMEQQVLAATYRTRQLPPLPATEPGVRRRPEAARRRARMPQLSSGRSWARMPRLSSGRSWARMPRLSSGRHWPRMPRLISAVATAAVAAVLVLGTAQVVTQHRLDETRASTAAVARILGAPDARIETMATTEGGAVTIVISGQQRAAVVSTRGMTVLPAGRVYQLWVIGASGAHSAGLLQAAGQNGPVLASGVLPGDRIGITVEPSGGTSRPTTTPIVVLPA
jgi:anti-sigma-K factor RskA